MNLDNQQDDFWRQILISGVGKPKDFQDKWMRFCKSLQAQVSHLPQAQQDEIITRVALRNQEYMTLAQNDREALRVRLGVTNLPSSVSRLTHIAAETAVRATIWQTIASLFRVPR